MKRPAEPPPRSKLLSSLCVDTSKITTFALDEPPNPPETNACLPSRVNFKRLPRTEIGNVWRGFFAATSMMVTVPSCAFATQICLPSGATSKPSLPPPAGTLVTRHVFRGTPGGGPGGGAEPGEPPGGGPKVGAEGKTCSMMLIVPELTFDVKTRSPLAETATMCVRSCPV